MKEATRIQIENMKNQTFGVEIEGNNITRKKAAEKAAAYFGTGRSEYTAGRNGYMTWSAWDAQGREWKFQRDVSIEGPDDQKCEMVTPILTYADMELLQGLVRILRKAGMKSDAGRGCGVHIHIGAKGHTPQTIRNLVNIMASHESQIAKAIKVDSWRQSRYCRTVDPRFLEQVNKKKPSTMSQLSNVWYKARIASMEEATTTTTVGTICSTFMRLSQKGRLNFDCFNSMLRQMANRTGCMQDTSKP